MIRHCIKWNALIYKLFILCTVMLYICTCFCKLIQCSLDRFYIHNTYLTEKQIYNKRKTKTVTMMTVAANMCPALFLYYLCFVGHTNMKLKVSNVQGKKNTPNRLHIFNHINAFNYMFLGKYLNCSRSHNKC